MMPWVQQGFRRRMKMETIGLNYLPCFLASLLFPLPPSFDLRQVFEATRMPLSAAKEPWQIPLPGRRPFIVPYRSREQLFSEAGIKGQCALIVGSFKVGRGCIGIELCSCWPHGTYCSPLPHGPGGTSHVWGCRWSDEKLALHSNSGSLRETGMFHHVYCFVIVHLTSNTYRMYEF